LKTGSQRRPPVTVTTPRLTIPGRCHHHWPPSVAAVAPDWPASHVDCEPRTRLSSCTSTALCGIPARRTPAEDRDPRRLPIPRPQPVLHSSAWPTRPPVGL